MTGKQQPDGRELPAPKPWNLHAADRHCVRCGKVDPTNDQPVLYVFGHQGQQVYRPIHHKCACEMLGWRKAIDEALTALGELAISMAPDGPCWCEYAVAGRHSTGCEHARTLTRGVTWQEH